MNEWRREEKKVFKFIEILWEKIQHWVFFRYLISKARSNGFFVVVVAAVVVVAVVVVEWEFEEPVLPAKYIDLGLTADFILQNPFIHQASAPTNFVR